LYRMAHVCIRRSRYGLPWMVVGAAPVTALRYALSPFDSLALSATMFLYFVARAHVFFGCCPGEVV
jgi:hypothetical protein